MFGSFGSNNQQQGTSGFGSFGATNQGQQQQPQQPQPAAGGGLFGGGFGSTPAAGTTQQNPAGGSLFGGATNTQNTGNTGGGLFGGAPAQTGGLFGNTNTNQQQPAMGGLFGNTQQNQPNTGGGLFGNASAANTTNTTTTAPTGGLFGSAPAQNTTGGGLFGNTTNNAQGTTGGGLFGNTSTNTAGTSGGGLFGNTNNTSTNTGGGLFGNTGNTAGARAVHVSLDAFVDQHFTRCCSQSLWKHTTTKHPALTVWINPAAEASRLSFRLYHPTACAGLIVWSAVTTTAEPTRARFPLRSTTAATAAATNSRVSVWYPEPAAKCAEWRAVWGQYARGLESRDADTGCTNARKRSSCVADSHPSPAATRSAVPILGPYAAYRRNQASVGFKFPTMQISGP